MLSILLTITIILGGEVVERDVSERGIRMIQRHELRMNKIYVCPGGVLTGGYGHALSREEKKKYKLNDKIHDELVDHWFMQDIDKAERVVNNWVTVEMSQGQFDALVSFVFNVGADAFKRSTLLKKLNKGQPSLAAKEFSRWIHAKGKILPGLVKRRTEEEKIFSEAEVAEV